MWANYTKTIKLCDTICSFEAIVRLNRNVHFVACNDFYDVSNVLWHRNPKMGMALENLCVAVVLLIKHKRRGNYFEMPPLGPIMDGLRTMSVERFNALGQFTMDLKYFYRETYRELVNDRQGMRQLSWTTYASYIFRQMKYEIMHVQSLVDQSTAEVILDEFRKICVEPDRKHFAETVARIVPDMITSDRRSNIHDIFVTVKSCDEIFEMMLQQFGVFCDGMYFECVNTGEGKVKLEAI